MIPWRRYIRFSAGVLGFPPREFWAMTLGEFHEAVEGHALAHGIPRPPPPPIREELEDMMRRFPD